MGRFTRKIKKKSKLIRNWGTGRKSIGFLALGPADWVGDLGVSVVESFYKQFFKIQQKSQIFIKDLETFSFLHQMKIRILTIVRGFTYTFL